MRHIISVADMTAQDLTQILEDAARIKQDPAQARLPRAHAAALLFERSSLRTRTAYEVAMMHIGGHAVTFDSISPLGAREALADVVRTFSQLVSVIIARVRDHTVLETLKQYAEVPVINALSNREHPIEVLADALTLRERWGTTEGRKLAFVGDGSNMCHSLMLLCPLIGLHLTVSSPKGYTPHDDIVRQAQASAQQHGTQMEFISNPCEAVTDADVVYTDPWPESQHGETPEQFLNLFAVYQINQKLLSCAKPDVVVLHCLPAKRGEEITADVLDGVQSLAFSRLSNLVPVTAAALRWLL